MKSTDIFLISAIAIMAAIIMAVQNLKINSLQTDVQFLQEKLTEMQDQMEKDIEHYSDLFESYDKETKTLKNKIKYLKSH